MVNQISKILKLLTRDIKYPDAIIKKNDPASSGARFISVRIVGIRGARIILTEKFKKKMPVSKNSVKINDFILL